LHKTNKYDTFFRKGNGNQSASTKKQLFTTNFWQMITVEMKKMGLTDAGTIAHGFNPEKQFDFGNPKKIKP
jgi:hypothetical protein